jgi:hypothetical protein
MSNKGGRPPKVPRVLKKYNLPDYGQKLEEMWTRQSNRLSIRELEVKLNAKLIQQAVKASADVDLDDFTAEDYYERLKNMDDDDDLENEAARTLQEHGVDISDLRDDFASYHSIFTYLRSRGANSPTTTETEPSQLVENVLQDVDETEKEASETIDEEIDRMSNIGAIPPEAPDVEVTVIVQCAYCGATHDIRSYIQRQGCGCEEEQQPELYGEIDTESIVV